MSQMNAVLTNVRGVNKTDVVTLTSNFGVSHSPLLRWRMNVGSVSELVTEEHRAGGRGRASRLSGLRREEGQETARRVRSPVQSV